MKRLEIQYDSGTTGVGRAQFFAVTAAKGGSVRSVIGQIFLFPGMVALMLLGIPAHPSFAAIDCSALEILAAAAIEVPPAAGRRSPLASALRDMRVGGDPRPLTVEEFHRQTAELALFLIGKRTADQMKQNRFFSRRTQKIDLEGAVRGLFEEDADRVKQEVEKDLEAHLKGPLYGGKSRAETEKRFDAAKAVVIVNHQTIALQGDTVAALSSHPTLKKLPAAWLVGAESSDPLTDAAVSQASAIRFSVGGGFDIPLSKASTVYLAGGAIDQCLTQTLHSVAMNTHQKEVTVKVLKGQSYIDMVGGEHLTLSHFFTNPPSNADEMKSRAVSELASLLADDGFQLEARRTAVLGSPLTFHGEGRTIRVEFVDSP